MLARARTCAIFVATAVASTAVGWAQESVPGSTVPVGSRIRVAVASEQVHLQGIVLAVDDSILTLAPGDRAPLKILLDAVERLEMRVGHKRNTLRGVVIGGVGMGLLGLTFSVDPEDCGNDSAHFCSRAEAVGFSALTGVLLGSLIGGLIETEQWMALGVESLMPTVARHRDGTAEVALSFAF